MQRHFRLVCALLAANAGLSAQQTWTVPAEFASRDAPSSLWLPGAGTALRLQVILDANVLGPLAGRDLVAISWRRDASARGYGGGRATWTVAIGVTTADSRSASPQFAHNAPSAALVFAGDVVLPATGPMPGPRVAWAAPNTLRIAFRTPFPYRGGNLLVDVTGRADARHPNDWWPADAAQESAQGTADSVGEVTGEESPWASVDAGSLIVGGTAQLQAWGTPGDFGIACFLGLAAAGRGPLAATGPPAPIQIPQRTDVLAAIVTTFTPLDPTLAAVGGLADTAFPVPNRTCVLGAGMASQWLDLDQQFAVGNAVQWTVAAGVPALGMAIVLADAGETSGVVSSTTAPVLRFEFR